jgi:hypothetical protein
MKVLLPTIVALTALLSQPARADKCSELLQKIITDCPTPTPKGAPVNLAQVANRYQSSNPKIGNIRIVAVVPSTESAAKILGPKNSKLGEGSFKSLNEISKRYSTKANSHLLRNEDGIGALEALFVGKENDLVILVGHSEETKLGRKFYFPDGQGFPLKDIHDRASKKGVHLLVLTCQSPDFALPRNISFADSLNIIEKLETAVKTSPLTKDELIQLVQIELRKEDRNIAVSIVLAVGSGAGTTIVLMMAADDDEEPDVAQPQK